MPNIIQEEIDTLKEWNGETDVSKVDYALYIIYENIYDDGYVMTDDEETQLRKALKENPHLQDEDLKNFVEMPELAKEGAWWLDPKNW